MNNLVIARQLITANSGDSCAELSGDCRRTTGAGNDSTAALPGPAVHHWLDNRSQANRQTLTNPWCRRCSASARGEAAMRRLSLRSFKGVAGRDCH